MLIFKMGGGLGLGNPQTPVERISGGGLSPPAGAIITDDGLNYVLKDDETDYIIEDA